MESLVRTNEHLTPDYAEPKTILTRESLKINFKGKRLQPPSIKIQRDDQTNELKLNKNSTEVGIKEEAG